LEVVIKTFASVTLLWHCDTWLWQTTCIEICILPKVTTRYLA